MSLKGVEGSESLERVVGAAKGRSFGMSGLSLFFVFNCLVV